MSIQRDNSLASLVQYGAEAEDSDAEPEPDFVDNISDEDEGPPSNQPALKRERDEADSEPTPPPVKKERRGKYTSTSNLCWLQWYIRSKSPIPKSPFAKSPFAERPMVNRSG